MGSHWLLRSPGSWQVYAHYGNATLWLLPLIIYSPWKLLWCHLINSYDHQSHHSWGHRHTVLSASSPNPEGMTRCTPRKLLGYITLWRQLSMKSPFSVFLAVFSIHFTLHQLRNYKLCRYVPLALWRYACQKGQHLRGHWHVLSLYSVDNITPAWPVSDF